MRQIGRDQLLLIGWSNRHRDFCPCQFRQVVGPPQGGHDYHGFIAPFPVERTGPLRHRQPCLPDVFLGHARLPVMGHLAQVIVQPADHDDREALARFDTVRCCPLNPLAVALRGGQDLRQGEAHRQCAGNPLGRAIFQHVQAGGRGRQLHRDVRSPAAEPTGHPQHGLSVCRTRGIHLGADITHLFLAVFKFPIDLFGGMADRDAHQRPGPLFWLQTFRKDGPDLIGPLLSMARKGQSGQEGIGGDTDGASLQTHGQFVRFGGVVPPGRLGAVCDPAQIILCHRGSHKSIPSQGSQRGPDSFASRTCWHTHCPGP